MKNQETALFRWIRSDIVRYWKIAAAIPLLYGSLMMFYNFVSYDFYSPWFALVSLLGMLPDVLVYLLFIQYLKAGEEAPAASSSRLSVETASSGVAANSLKAFFWGAAGRWFISYLFVGFMGSWYGNFLF